MREMWHITNTPATSLRREYGKFLFLTAIWTGVYAPACCKNTAFTVSAYAGRTRRHGDKNLFHGKLKIIHPILTASMKVVLNTTLIQTVTPRTLDESSTKQVGEKASAVVSTRNYRAQT